MCWGKSIIHKRPKDKHETLISVFLGTTEPELPAEDQQFWLLELTSTWAFETLFTGMKLISFKMRVTPDLQHPQLWVCTEIFFTAEACQEVNSKMIVLNWHLTECTWMPLALSCYSGTKCFKSIIFLFFKKPWIHQLPKHNPEWHPATGTRNWPGTWQINITLGHYHPLPPMYFWCALICEHFLLGLNIKGAETEWTCPLNSLGHQE